MDDDAKSTRQTGLALAVTCPGCGLRQPADTAAAYHGSFNASPECWAVFNRVLALEFGDAVVFGQVHQLSVDAYAVQHAGGGHPDKSVAVHLAGLYLALERGVPPVEVAPRLQRLATWVARHGTAWPHFRPPEKRGERTALDVAEAGTPAEHVRLAGKWAQQAWAAWGEHHEAVAAFVASSADREGPGARKI